MRAVDAAQAMGERTVMRGIAIIAAFASFGALAAAPGLTAPPARDAPTAASNSVSDLSAQSRPKRVRPQIRVTPRYPYRSFHTAYPLPYPHENPGPNAVRQCVDRYVTELRPSGPIIVPRMRCWWVRG